MLSIENETLIRDSGTHNLTLIRQAIPLGSDADAALNAAMEAARMEGIEERKALMEDVEECEKMIHSLNGKIDRHMATIKHEADKRREAALAASEAKEKLKEAKDCIEALQISLTLMSKQVNTGGLVIPNDADLLKLNSADLKNQPIQPIQVTAGADEVAWQNAVKAVIRDAGSVAKEQYPSHCDTRKLAVAIVDLATAVLAR